MPAPANMSKVLPIIRSMLLNSCSPFKASMLKGIGRFLEQEIRKNPAPSRALLNLFEGIHSSQEVIVFEVANIFG